MLSIAAPQTSCDNKVVVIRAIIGDIDANLRKYVGILNFGLYRDTAIIKSELFGTHHIVGHR